ncbi:molybdopterin-synthase adenylyltransferase MoeB [Sulfitobacter pseudonitzschiae]|uniref:Molybdopterin-synthase adenylyltransferase n=1 Tax=Pseudosulfitobacter pseudonitzschiae TaxID=1402135 RepID=A0A9Q2NSL1_9RHOB|nr:MULTISPECIES: molybdopterin-synthase adenylyltransferase MoeB [Roseobacteraceae]MBM2293664.1 molybdopterin-synthase adenylyltransferase MoeB [Pseudosulfitobacter pseudonitzschiae]MBM2298478.1 molybdopterin-synthase adenylyltransferase MoeB [Pseudosulfitobacter pseudonitzschiae]MBM2303392.1 molybdopterin-synthase adenylyltransferase MoeB [Pseudosulfitobacter pseudonitzschiae]MBM2313175.1 molybdopterin-synthase adenylyltransferase MoeB [Pseudosulfitobacter pseudonitzschiae]MBM2318088.1 molybd|tara:strand:+ start:665 stop:1711 length:1047 start_codon:yes stop_codon:yes gene_type:complete
MILVLALAAALWGVGAMMGAPRAVRLNMVLLLYVAVLALHLVLPDAHPLRMATGESAALWLILGGFVVLVLAYRWGLRRLKAKAAGEQAEVPQPQIGPMTEVELNRYSRHIVLREIGGPGQVALKNARVLVVGAGGLGAPALQYLAAAGVGTIGVIDADVVEGSNLQRQVIHTDARIGMPKVFSAQAALEALNPFITVRPYHRRFDADIAAELVAEYDLVLDGTDNFDTRYLVNRTAVAAGVPLISGALSQWEGQLSVFDPARGAPCYQCIFPQAPADGLAPSCAEAGVLGPLPGVVGAMMAVEAVKLLTDAGTPLRGEMLIYDALYGESRKITLARRGDCPVCGDKG